MKTNAKEEFLEINETIKSPVICAEIETDDRKAKLPLEYTMREWSNFLKEIDFIYDNGYGGQELFGYVWFGDGSWLERAEYDGSEWWVLKNIPEIPESLIKE
jgi:hypothetical protein